MKPLLFKSTKSNSVNFCPSISSSWASCSVSTRVTNVSPLWGVKSQQQRSLVLSLLCFSLAALRYFCAVRARKLLSQLKLSHSVKLFCYFKNHIMFQFIQQPTLVKCSLSFLFISYTVYIAILLSILKETE